MKQAYFKIKIGRNPVRNSKVMVVADGKEYTIPVSSIYFMADAGRPASSHLEIKLPEGTYELDAEIEGDYKFDPDTGKVEIMNIVKELPGKLGDKPRGIGKKK